MSPDDTEGEETVQLSLTIKKSTLEALDELYPHLLKPQHQLLAAVSEVEENRVQTRALLDFQGAAQIDQSGIDNYSEKD